MAIETLRPDVYVIEKDGMPRITGVSVNTAGFVGVAEKGPVDRAELITNYDQFVATYGQVYRGSYLEPCIRTYFMQGGARAYISRVVGQGAGAAWSTIKNVGESGGPAIVRSAAGPFNLEPGENLVVMIEGYAPQTFTFTGTQAYVQGNGFTGNDLNGKTLEIQFSGWDARTITFTGLPASPTPQDVINFLNPVIQGGAAIVDGGEIDFRADQRGSGSFVHILGGTALGDLGHNMFKTYGTGNVPNIDEVSAKDAAQALAGLVGAYPIAYNNFLELVTVERGTLVSIRVAVASTANFGFDNDLHYGWGDSGSPAKILTSHAEPFNLEPGEVLSLNVQNAPPQNLTFLATQAVLTGSGFDGSDLAGKTIQVQFSGYDATTVTFPANTSVQGAVNVLNAHIWGGSAAVSGGEIVLRADQFGLGSFVQILGGTGLTDLGFVVGGSVGTGNVQHIDKVTAQEVVDLVNASINDVVASIVHGNQVKISTTSTGDNATIQVNYSLTTATGLGFHTNLVRGADADYMDAMEIEADNPGAWGNNVGIRTLSWMHETRAEVSNTDTEISISSVRGLSVGDIFYIFDPSFESKRFVGVISQIHVADRKISVLPMVGDLVGIIPAGSPIMSCSQHRMSSASTETLANGQDHLTVLSTNNLRVGARVVITDGSSLADVLVTGIDGNVLRFAPVTLPATILAGAQVVSQEFKLQVLEKGEVVETHDFLSMEEESTDYVGVRLAGRTNESRYIRVTDLYASPEELWKRLPLPSMRESLSYGTDGATPTDDDFIGDLADPKTGMWLFDALFDVNFIAIPGITTVTVQKEMSAYCELKGTIMCILDAPLWADQATEIYNYRMFDLNLDSSQSALYYPWPIIRNPNVGDALMPIPPSGHIAGEYAATGATRGVHVSPANVPMRGVVDFTHHITDGENDILNPVGVNCLRMFPGEGHRIWGARTLQSAQDGRHYVSIRRLLNFVKVSVRRGNRWAVYQPNDPRLWELLTDVNKAFFHGMWERGMLFPSNNESQAYFVKCDEETNPLSERKAGRVNCEVGVNGPIPAEFVKFSVGLWDGGSSISEEILRRG